MIDDALRLGCDWFHTLDYKTIWRHRDHLAHFGIEFATPSEVAAQFFAPS